MAGMTECMKFLKFAQVQESFLKSRIAFLMAFEAGSFFVVEVMMKKQLKQLVFGGFYVFVLFTYFYVSNCCAVGCISLLQAMQTEFYKMFL